jgi:DeoR/GlpR family transcriptional regulator of sugar metabolism
VRGADRRHAILARVAEDQTIHVGELARELGCSEMTIRRDIRRLERDGFIRQTYGGATAHITRSFDISFNARALQAAREKRLIGMRAASLVQDARVLFVGIGSTTEQFAQYLPAGVDRTVVTASLPIASLLGTRALNVVVLGGPVLHDELTCVGPTAMATLANYRFDAAVIGAAGISARWGITELTEDEAAVQRVALERTERVIVVADGSKVGSATPIVVADAKAAMTLVTDPSAAGDELEALRALGIEMVIAERAAPARADSASAHTESKRPTTVAAGAG